MARGASGDKRPGVRTAAVSTLEQMHSTDSTPVLKQMLSDQDPSVVIAAARSGLAPSTGQWQARPGAAEQPVKSASRRGWIKELSGHLGARTTSLAQ